MITNGLEIRPNGSFSSCCITKKIYHDENGQPYSIYKDSIETVWNSQDRKQFVENFDGHFGKYCKVCKEIEQCGGRSKRTNEIHNFGKHDGNTSSIYYLDLKMGNTCNLACSICGPKSSSKWASFYKQLGLKNIKIEQWQDQDDFWDQLPDISNHLKRIELTGGEPFMIKKQERLLKFLTENNISENIEITWITNTTVWPAHLVKYFEKFKLVRIMLSLDNTGKQFEYIRYPGVWDTAYEIFLKWKELEKQGIIDLGISHSIGFLNAWHLADFHAWCREHEVMIYNNMIMAPMSAKDLPYEFKLRVKEKLAQSTSAEWQVNPIVGEDNWFTKFMMQDGDFAEAERYHNKVVIPTRSRAQFEDAFPELKDYL